MSDEEWTVEDDAMLLLHGRDQTHPAFIAQRFLYGVLFGKDGDNVDDDLRRLTTEASRDRWDFDALRRLVSEIPGAALSTAARPAAEDAKDVALVRILVGQPELRIVDGPEFVEVGAVLVLIWHPDPGIWLIHTTAADEDDVKDLTDLPRPSPGVAPDYWE